MGRMGCMGCMGRRVTGANVVHNNLSEPPLLVKRLG